VGAFAVAVAVVVALALSPGAALAADGGVPGAPGVGDPYFPLDGNGGYEVQRYKLELRYDPATDVLKGIATIRARARQHLSRFNLDLVGMQVRWVSINGRRADWARDGSELTVIPRATLRRSDLFTAELHYDGVPQTLPDGSGFVHTDDGAVAVGQPDSAALWFPVNDHPIDPASYSFRITAPAGLEAVANGVLTSTRTHAGWTTWRWDAAEQMAPYLATIAIGEFDLRSYQAGGLPYWDALDPDLFRPFAPRTGERFLLSGFSQPSYKRLTRTIAVPASGAELSFWVDRETETNWDFLFVEAHAAGSDQWTTLPDANGHTSADTGRSCPFWLELHPWLGRYQTANADGACSPRGTTGEWWAASGSSGGYEQWKVDLSRYAGSAVEVSISYAGDDFFQFAGVHIDDIVVSTGEGSTSFEGGDLAGWTVAGAPGGSQPNPDDWRVGGAADAPEPTGARAERSLARQPEIIDFLEGIFGPYPFSTAGAIVDDLDLGFALETQTRPFYSTGFFAERLIPALGDGVVVHELAHQWVGDHLALERWQHIWLNEGFASYMEWLWSEHEGRETAQELFDERAQIPADSPFWTVPIGDPGPEQLFDGAVYERGAMTLHALRGAIGDDAFFSLLREWVRTQGPGNVSTDEFVALAERISGQQLDALFQTWLLTASKPAGIEPPAARSRSHSGAQRGQALQRHHAKR
jgi:Peptidase family M1 domain/Peptidase M1 N-terminal domain